MTARRSFWSLTAFLAIYLTSALHMDAGNPRPDPLGGRALQAQNGVTSLLNTLLLPASWSLGQVQRLFSHSSAGDQSLSPEQIAELQQQHAAMLSELSQLQTELTQRTTQLRELHAMLGMYPSLSQATWLPGVNIVGRSASGASDTLTLDCGTRDHVLPGMFVIANFAPVGKIISVGPTSSLVRLISDKSSAMIIQASIIRLIPGSPPKTIAKTCQVEGLGNGQLACKDVNAYSGDPPIPGDIVVVNADSSWRPLDGAYIGQVEKVGHTDQGTRFDLTISSYADIPNLRQVWVVLLQP